MSRKVQETPDYLIFAEGAKQEELNEFPDVNRGWGATIELTDSKPPMEWFNGAFNRVDKHMLYLLQQGVPEWSNKVTYPVNAVIKYNGILYIATNENNNAKPSTNTTKWKKLLDDASLTKKGIVQLNSAVNSVSESEAATPLAVKKAYDLASNAQNSANTANDTAKKANEKANNAYPKTGGIVEGLIKSNQPKTYDIVASNSWVQAAANTLPNAILAHEAGGGGFAIVTGADDAKLGKTANLTFASWNGVGFAPMHASGQKDTAINSTVVVNCRLGTVYALNGFYEQGKKLIKQDEYGVGHQNLSLTKVSDNLNEQNASFFGSTYVNMPESIKPYIKIGSGVAGVILPYRTTSDGWKFSSRFFTEVGVSPSKLFYQECDQGTWQKPLQLITDENIKSHIGSAHIIETYKSEDGSSWYRKWSDGFVEQGGVKHGQFNINTVHNLITPFSSNEYVILVNTLALGDTVSPTGSAQDKQPSTFRCEASRANSYNYAYTSITFLAYGYQ
nr:phage tail protein [Frischella perrara]